MIKKILLLSDTHGFLDNRVLNYAADVDEIWHAGDIGDFSVTDALEKIKPLRAVYGNIDNAAIRQQFGETLFFELEGVKVFMIHIGGKPYKYAKGVAEQIERLKPDVFVCGHSHILRVEYDKKRSMLYINPGAAGKHGFHKKKTLIKFELYNGVVQNLVVIELGTQA
jgi:putative phosphoesterase